MAEIQRPPGLVPLSLGFPEGLLRALVLGPDLLLLGSDGSDAEQETQEESRQGTKGQPLPPASCSFHSVDPGKGVRISHRIPLLF
jgi:hypothetical protein